jgi:hypothetical protein
MTRILLLALLLWAPSLTVSPKTLAEDLRGALRFGADLGLGVGIRYAREIEQVETVITPRPSAQLMLSTHYMFAPYVGLGFELGGAYTPLDDAGLIGAAWALDLGPSPTMRIPFEREDLTLRIPFGLTYGNALAADTGPTVLGARTGIFSTSDRMGPGVHVAGLVGAALWLRRDIALRFETGPWWRTYRIHEGATVYAGDVQFGTVERDVSTRLLIWLIQMGVEWAPR